MNASASRLSLCLLITPFALWILLLVLLPHLQMLRVSFQVRESWDTISWGVQQYQNFFSESYYWRTFLRTGLMSLFTTFLTLIIAFPIAWYIAKLARGRAKGLLFFACLIPFWASELVRTYGWMILLRESGLFSTWLQYLGFADGPVEMLYNDVAVIIGLVYNGLLFMLVPLVTSRFWPDRPRIRFGRDALAYLLIVIFDVIVANFEIAWIILTRRNRDLRSCWLVIPTELRSAEAITVLAGTISLTPGTVSSDISSDGRALLVHALDVADPVAEVARIKQRYETRLMKVFR